MSRWRAINYDLNRYGQHCFVGGVAFGALGGVTGAVGTVHESVSAFLVGVVILLLAARLWAIHIVERGKNLTDIIVEGEQ